MRWIGRVLVAAILAAVVLPTAGCDDRGASGVTPPASAASTPGRAETSPSARSTPASQRPGATCAEIVQAVSQATGVSWRLRDDSPVDDRDAARPGARKCSTQAASTARTPAALLTVTLGRPAPGTDTPQSLREQAERRADGCTTALPDRPGDVTYATSCVERKGGTLVTATTTLLNTAGWVSVWVSAQHPDSASAAAQADAFVKAASRSAALRSLPLI